MSEMKYDLPDKREWMRLKEAASYMGVEPSTLYSYVHEGIVPYYKPFKKGRNKKKGILLFKRSDIDEWIEKGRVETKEEALERVRKERE